MKKIVVSLKRENDAVGPYDVKYFLYKKQFGVNSNCGTVNGKSNRTFQEPSIRCWGLQ